MKRFFPNPPPLKVHQATRQGYIMCYPFGCFDSAFPQSRLRRARVQGGGKICPALMAGEPEVYVYEGMYIEE